MSEENQTQTTDSALAEETSTDAAIVQETKAIESEGTTAITGDGVPQESAEPKSVVPEKYDLKLPENSVLDEGAVDEIAAFSREQGLSNDQAQKILERENGKAQAAAAQQQEGLQKASDTWLDELKADKELGGENLEQTIAHAKRGFEKFAGPELRDWVNRTGLGNNKLIVGLFAKIGKAHMGDSLILGGPSQAPEKKTLENIFYPNQEN